MQETQDLEAKYIELKKECEEKMELMSKQIEEQESKQGSIEETLDEQI